MLMHVDIHMFGFLIHNFFNISLTINFINNSSFNDISWLLQRYFTLKCILFNTQNISWLPISKHFNYLKLCKFNASHMWVVTILFYERFVFSQYFIIYFFVQTTSKILCFYISNMVSDKHLFYNINACFEYFVILHIISTINFKIWIML